MNIYSKIHSLYYRLINKINRVNKRKRWSAIPIQEATTFFSDKAQLFDPHLVGAQTLGKQMTNHHSITDALEILDKITPNDDVEFAKKFYKKGLEIYGDNWVYADINTALITISRNVDVQNYMEIGVRRGRSMAMLASKSPNANLYGFDMWIQNYCGSENPGPEFVEEELRSVGFSGNAKFIDGDSKKTVPVFFKENPDLFFDVITVDGDHSIGGATVDLKNVIERLKIGGILVFDDITSQEHSYLDKVWNKTIKNRDNFYTYEFGDIGLGVAIAIRKY
tara:strand:+ start:7734 stop:8570 length:837 start_codon:yes stop_codon:yes gene_type:complete